MQQQQRRPQHRQAHHKPRPVTATGRLQPTRPHQFRTHTLVHQRPGQPQVGPYHRRKVETTKPTVIVGKANEYRQRLKAGPQEHQDKQESPFKRQHCRPLKKPAGERQAANHHQIQVQHFKQPRRPGLGGQQLQFHRNPPTTYANRAQRVHQQQAATHSNRREPHLKSQATESKKNSKLSPMKQHEEVELKKGYSFGVPQSSSQNASPSKKSLKKMSSFEYEEKYFGNKSKQITPFFSICQELKLQAKFQNLSSIELSGPRSGFLTENNNIMTFEWQDPDHPSPVNDNFQNNHCRIYAVKDFFSKLIVVEKFGNRVQFVLKSLNGAPVNLASSTFDPFDSTHYQNSVYIQNEDGLLFIRLEQNKLLLFTGNLKTTGKIEYLGETQFRDGCCIVDVKYINKSKKIFVFFETGQYSVLRIKEILPNKIDIEEAGSMMFGSILEAAQNQQAQNDPSGASPVEILHDLVDMQNIDPKRYELQNVLITQLKGLFVASVKSTETGGSVLKVYELKDDGVTLKNISYVKIPPIRSSGKNLLLFLEFYLIWFFLRISLFWLTFEIGNPLSIKTLDSCIINASQEYVLGFSEKPICAYLFKIENGFLQIVSKPIFMNNSKF